MNEPTNVQEHAPSPAAACSDPQPTSERPDQPDNKAAGEGRVARLVRCSSLSPNGWIVFPSEDAYQIACNDARKAGDADRLEHILNRSLLDWPASCHRLKQREPSLIFRVNVVRQDEDDTFQTFLVGKDLRVLFEDLGKLLLSGVVAHCSVSVESVKIESHV